MKTTNPNITKLKKNEIFVFGSNLNGNHAGGAAKLALEKFGAVGGQPIGLQGQSYAIPTLDNSMQKINIDDLQIYIAGFIEYAKNNTDKTFLVTEIGCGIAGFTKEEIAPLFKDAVIVENISLPQSFLDLLLVRGFKVTDANCKCRGFKFELNKTYTETGKIIACLNGFHLCQELKDCFQYYDFNPNNRVFECIGFGDIAHEDNKVAVRHIQLLREISWLEVLYLVNLGKGNSGIGNAGNDNAGYYNAGYYNAGNRNAGYYNAGNDNAGAFNNLQANYMMFNKPSKWTFEDFINSKAYSLMSEIEFQIYVPLSLMSEEELKQHPYAKTTLHYYKQIGYKEAWQNAWNKWNENSRNAFKSLPNFDAEIFKDITGIDV